MAEVAPLPWKTIPDLLRDVTQRYADLEAVVDGEVRLGFADLGVEVERVARSLAAAGIEPGDRVAIWASNSWRWVAVACGVWQRGAVLVPLATRWKAPEVGPLIERTEARLLFAESESANEKLLPTLLARFGGSHAEGPIGGLETLERIICLDGRSTDVVEIAETWDAFLASGEGEGTPDRARVGPEDLAEILFTSGTTGSPKGVELCHQQLLQAYWDWSGIGGLEPADRFLVIPPYSHGFGINGGILACLMRGVTNVPVAVFDSASALDSIARERISIISGPPTLFATLMGLEDFDSADTTSLRVAFVGASSVPTELIRAMRERMGIDRVINAYGLIEACVISMTRADDPPEVIATTTGRVVPGVEVRILSADGVDVEDGEPGEVLVRSQGVMRGYWRDPDQTAATMEPGGWCRTGDVGVRDGSGCLRIVDRLKDAYNCGGFSAYPAEIENQLLEREEIAQVAVVGVPHERLGEVGHAFVIPAPNRSIDESELIAWARENMANYKVPRRVVVLDVFPLNANGKVRKDELRRRACQESGLEARRRPG